MTIVLVIITGDSFAVAVAVVATIDVNRLQ